MKSIYLCTLLTVFLTAFNVQSEVVICQYASWAVYRPTAGALQPHLIDPVLCTHGVYLTAGLDDNDDFIALDPWADLDTDGGLGGYKKFTSLKQQNSNFKPLLALGSWAYANSHYAAIAANATRRANFAQNAVAYLKLHGFEGLEVDWLYPVTPNEKTNFPLLLEALRSAFDAENFELVATVGALETTVEQSYDLAGMERSLHYFLMIGYDYEGAWNPYTGLSTPLYIENNTLSANSTVNAYLSRGVNPAQLVLGVPGFGRTYTLADETANGIGDASLGPGDGGHYTFNPGVLSFLEWFEDSSSWTEERHTLSQSPYAYKGNQWVTYEDETSAQFKVEYCKSNGLGGVAIWTVDEDNFVDGVFTLTRAFSEAFGN